MDASQKIVAIDIGYSNVKVAWGPNGQRRPGQVRTFPAGALPANRMGQRVVGGDSGLDEEGVIVQVGQEDWVAGVEPDLMAAWSRELHEGYVDTQAYTALFHAALKTVGMTHIPVLVTGLPVRQTQDPDEVAKVRAKMVGHHKVDTHTEVHVDEVHVVAQPVGAYFATFVEKAAQDAGLRQAFQKGRAIVGDPGYYSVDWTVMDRGFIQAHISGTSTNATSTLLEEAAREIARQIGTKNRINPARLEQALREGESSIVAFAREIDLTTPLKIAQETVAAQAATEIRQSLRSQDEQPADVVILTGGGAPYYREAFQEVFDAGQGVIPVLVPENPVTANVRGYWHYGCSV